jgi:hypothetical protein
MNITFSNETGVNPATSARNQQIINGKAYTMYTPEWVAAQQASTVTGGKTLGQTAKAAYDAMGNPADTSSSSSNGLNGIRNALNGNTPARIGPAEDFGSDIYTIGSGGSNTPTDGSEFSTITSGSDNASASGGGSLGRGIPQISQVNQDAAESAQFGKAKDQVGQETAGGLTALRSALAGRGMLGSGAEYRGTQGVVNKGQGELGDVSRQQAVTHLANEMDINKANQAAALTGRGQNMDYSLGARGQDITQRGQDIQQQEANAQLQMTQSLQQAAQRQAILQGIMSAINTSSLY